MPFVATSNTHIYIFIYLRVYASAIGMYNVFIAAIQRITSVYVMLHLWFGAAGSGL